MKSLLLIATLGLCSTSFAAKAPEFNDAQFAKHFEFRFAEYKKAKAKGTERRPSSSNYYNDMASEQDQKEQKNIAQEFRTKTGSYFQILETVAILADKGQKKEKIAAMLPDLVAKQIANTKSMTYKALRFQQIAGIDGRNSGGGFEFPVEAKSISVMGPIGENVDLRERCSIDEKTKAETCSQGWTSWPYLVAVNAEGCHNSGCDTAPNLLKVSISFIPAVFDGSGMEENAKPKMLKRAHYKVDIEELVTVTTLELPKEDGK